MLPLHRNGPIDFHCKSISQLLFNGNTWLKSVKWNSWKSGWSFKVRPRSKPFYVDTQPKLNVLKTFIWRTGRYMNVICMFNLLYCYRDSYFPQRSWASERDSLKLEISGKKYWFFNKSLNVDWVRGAFCILILRAPIIYK